MFTPTSHPFVGTTRAYLPQGCTPYAPDYDDGEGGVLILPAGDAVDVLSAWSRPYLPDDAPTVLYVRSHATGQCAHVTPDELPLGVSA